MSWEFFVGQRVVCVDDVAHAYSDGTYHVVPLRRGEEYVIRELEVTEFDEVETVGLGVKVNGVFRPDPYGKTADEYFGAKRFRPLQTKYISLFRSIAQGVTDGKPVVPDTDAPLFDEPVMPEFVGRPLLSWNVRGDK